MRAIRLLLVVGVAGATGCATTPWPWSARANESFTPPCKAACSAVDAQNALSAASNYCLHLINESANSKAMVGTSKVALSTLGALSGSVIAQIAEGSASKAWAGVAGVTSGMRSSMDEAFAGAIYVQRKRQIALATSEGVNAVLQVDDDDPSKRVDLAIQMAVSCASAAAKSDAETMQAISAPREADPTGAGEDAEDEGDTAT